MTTHEAGWAHAAGALAGPAWLRTPDDVNDLHPLLWSRTAPAPRDGGVEVGGVDVRDLLAGAQLAGVRPRRGRLPGPRSGVP